MHTYFDQSHKSFEERIKEDLEKYTSGEITFQYKDCVQVFIDGKFSNEYDLTEVHNQIIEKITESKS